MPIRILNLALAALFAASAAAQLNDPDPLLWVPVYGAVAALCAGAAWARFQFPATVALLAVCLGGALYLMPSAWHLLAQEGPRGLAAPMSAQRPHVEEAREALGLLLAAAALGHLLALARRRQSSPGVRR